MSSNRIPILDGMDQPTYSQPHLSSQCTVESLRFLTSNGRISLHLECSNSEVSSVALLRTRSASLLEEQLLVSEVLES